jgi:hypothetical protein
MTFTYTEVKDENGVLLSITRSDGASIPADESNSDYQRYLNPEAEHFTPIVAAE